MQPRATLRVLIADDNADAAETLGTYFGLLGLEVTVVADGLAAVRQATLRMPGAVILDLGMPVIDGWTACAEIRKLPGSEKVRIIALSAWGSDEARQRCVEVGFDAHCLKPAHPEMLLRMLSQGCETIPAVDDLDSGRPSDRASVQPVIEEHSIWLAASPMQVDLSQGQAEPPGH